LHVIVLRLPALQLSQSLLPANPPLIGLAWRWTTWWSIVVLVRVHILWWLHLDIIPATEIALIRTAILVLVVATLRILVGVLVSVLWRLLVILIWLVRWRCAHRQSLHEASSIVWLAACLSASSLGDAGAKEEEQECNDENDSKRHPSSPIIPSATTVVVLSSVGVVACSHDGGYLEGALLWRD